MKALTEEGQHHRVVVGHDEEVDTVERCTRLQVAERLPELAVLSAVVHINLNIRFKLTKHTIFATQCVHNLFMGPKC